MSDKASQWLLDPEVLEALQERDDKIERLQKLVAEIETRCDPAGDTATITKLREDNGAQRVEIEQLRIAKNIEFHRGYAAALRNYAWWKDGVQHVGTSGTTLATALDRVAEAVAASNQRSKLIQGDP